MKLTVCLLAKVFLILACFYPSFVMSAEEIEWTAHWIMHPYADPQAHSVIIFRKNFNLDAKPERFIVHISADNHYRLFINGCYITRGPARGDLSHWFYETIDIADYLAKGKNAIAVEVVNWGPKRSFTFFSQMTSFILQGDSKSEDIINTAGGAWKCYRNEAVNPKLVDWMNDRSTIDFGLYVGNPTDSIRGDRYPWGWQERDYDDTGWLPARWCDIAGGRNTQYAGGILYSGGKMLIPRRTPLLKETRVPFTCVKRVSGIEKNEGFIHNSGTLTIPAHTRATILIDQQYETLGYPEMIVSSGRDSRIQVMYAENLIKGQKSPKGDRNETDGKYMVGIKDVFLPDGGYDRLFKPTYIRAFRFIQLDIETAGSPLIINNYYNVACRAPLELRADFRTGLPDLDWIMEAGWRTVSICAQDMLISDAAYEQMQYVGDSRVHNLSLLTLSGDDKLTRNSLIQFDQSRIPEGLTYACYPNPFYLIIPSYSLIWIDQVYDYMFWKDDMDFIRQFTPGITSVLDWYDRKIQPNGLLGKIDWWGALAWPRHYKNGEPPSVYDGNNTLYTLHYAYTLRHASVIFRYVGDTLKAEEYKNQADRICEAVNRLCRSRNGFYNEYPGSDKISQITNIMAIISGASEGDDAKVLMKELLLQKDWFGQVDLFLHLYLFEAMEKTGCQNQFINELSEWRLMKEKGLSTFVEVPLEWGEENQRSECHPWSTSPNYFFFRNICGIHPLAAGHKSVEIRPVFGILKRISAIYPHHIGNIEMDLERNESGILGSVTIPDGMNATFVWGEYKISLRPGKQNVELP